MEISRSRGGSTLEESVSERLDAEPAQITWDSYRTDDARWIVTAALGDRIVGSWNYETVGRTVHPLDESSRALMGGGPSSVAESHQATSFTDSPSEATVLPEPEQSPEQARPRLVSVTSDPLAADQGSTPQHPEEQPSAPVPAPDVPLSADALDSDDALLDRSEVTSAPKRAKRAKGRKGRASVPSWDEILFGASRPED